VAATVGELALFRRGGAAALGLDAGLAEELTAIVMGYLAG
jgi:hypothetical protein